jgi:hypothetical protein
MQMAMSVPLRSLVLRNRRVRMMKLVFFRPNLFRDHSFQFRSGTAIKVWDFFRRQDRFLSTSICNSVCYSIHAVHTVTLCVTVCTVGYVTLARQALAGRPRVKDLSSQIEQYGLDAEAGGNWEFGVKQAPRDNRVITTSLTSNSWHLWSLVSSA